ncbi:AbrB/MazE/SpoVT family DNA-binding domain-containing protein [Vampirovibrio sp.]|uniref:AbrB/MazE/SpoVT family DNA-binding domain-containing protein n=1 Tax=Vampirovibrio sp. TaxID=2717857 RepID=UPI0035936F0C
MKAKLQKIGNSKGIRIPKAIIDEIGFETAVELTVENNRLVIAPVRGVRADWERGFQGVKKEPLILPDTFSNEFDQDEWTW